MRKNIQENENFKKVKNFSTFKTLKAKLKNSYELLYEKIEIKLNFIPV